MFLCKVAYLKTTLVILRDISYTRYKWLRLGPPLTIIQGGSKKVSCCTVIDISNAKQP